jgi:hypothetical protein
MTGDYRHLPVADQPLLQQIRNQFGLAWLNTYRNPKQ